MVRKTDSGKKSVENPRIARRERRRAQSREEILEATRVVLKRVGTHGLTLELVAQELELTKAALYYYFPSKDALLFATLHAELRTEADAIAEAVEKTDSGGEALHALIQTSVEHYSKRLDSFRLAYLYGQVAGSDAPKPTADMLDHVRPINDLVYGSVERKLEADGPAGTSSFHARRLAFLAHMAAVGLLTMKGMVEAADDPLIHSDADLVKELSEIFELAARERLRGC